MINAHRAKLDKQTNVHTEREFHTAEELRAYLLSTVTHCEVKQRPAPGEPASREAVIAAPWRHDPEKRHRSTHDIGRITAHKFTGGRNAAAIARAAGDGVCDNPACRKPFRKTGKNQRVCGSETCERWKYAQHKQGLRNRRKARAADCTEHTWGPKGREREECKVCGKTRRALAVAA